MPPLRTKATPQEMGTAMLLRGLATAVGARIETVEVGSFGGYNTTSEQLYGEL